MATYVLDGDNGVDAAGRGSQSSPLKTHAYLIANVTLNPGDYVFRYGTFRESVVWPADMQDVHVGQLYGFAQATIRGDTDITGTTGSWTQIPATNAYTKDIGAGLSVAGVVWNFGTDGTGRLIGALALQATALLVESVANGWFYDAGTGLLTVNVGANPGTGAISWSVGGVNAEEAANATKCRWVGTRYLLWMDGTAGNGYGLFVYGTDNTVRKCVFDYTGYHAAGFVGGVNVRNRMEGCVTGACRSGIPFVWYSASGNHVTGGRGIGLVCYAYVYLKPDGTPMSGSESAGFVYAHTDAGGAQIRDLQIENSVVYHYADSPTSQNFSASNVGSVGSVYDWKTYPVRFVGCRLVGGRRFALHESAAYVRCRFLCPRANLTGVASGANGVAYDVGSANGTRWLFESCEFIADLGLASTATQMFRLGTNSVSLRLVNVSLYNSASNTSAARRFFFFAGSTATAALVECHGCVFAHASATNGVLVGENLSSNEPAPTTNMIFTGCDYFNVTTYCTNSSNALDTFAEWAASVDTSARALALAPYANPAADLRPAPGRTTRQRRSHQVRRAALGINASPHSAHRGAWQYAPPARRGVLT